MTDTSLPSAFATFRLSLPCAPFVAVIALCLNACSGPAPSSHGRASAVADAIRQVHGNDFPQLLVAADGAKASDAPTLSDSNADFCAGFRAKTKAELDRAWRPTVDSVRLDCIYVDEDHTVRAIAVAKLRDGAVMMFDVPVLEVRSNATSDGDTWNQYVLLGSVRSQGKTLAGKIREHCLAQRAAVCSDVLSDAQDGYSLQTGEATKIHIAPGRYDPQRFFYSEMLDG